MNIQQNEEGDSKLIGVEDGEYRRIGGTDETKNGSEANGLVHRTPLERKSTVLHCSTIGRFSGIRKVLFPLKDQIIEYHSFMKGYQTTLWVHYLLN